jgi:hypothetical protein
MFMLSDEILGIAKIGTKLNVVSSPSKLSRKPAQMCTPFLGGVMISSAESSDL